MLIQITVTVEGAGAADRRHAAESMAMALVAAGWSVVVRDKERMAPSTWSIRVAEARKAAGPNGRLAIIKTKAAPL